MENEKHLMAVDGLKDIVGAIDNVLQRKTRESMVDAARRKIEQEYSWKTIADKLLSAWQTAYERNR